MTHLPRLNLRNKLLLFAVVIAIIPLIVAGQSLIRIARDEMKSSANDQLLTTAQQVSGEIDDLFEHAWMAPLQLIRNAVDEEGLGIPEKIALLNHGIADLHDIVALQLSIDGSKVAPVVQQKGYAEELSAKGLVPLNVLRTPPETVFAAVDTGADRTVSVDYVEQADKWLVTVILPLKAPIAGKRGAFSARIDLGRIEAAIGQHPFQRTGAITVVDRSGHQILDKGRADLSGLDIVKQATSLLAQNTPVSSVESYVRPDGAATLGGFSFANTLGWAVLTEKSEANAYFAVGEMIKSLGFWLALGLAAAAIGAIVFAVRISRPILKIGVAATEVGQGNFRARVTGVKSRDEIGDLAQRINTMIVQINERFQLAKFVSGAAVAAVQKADHEGVKLGGTRRVVAILFADIRGYTAFSEHRDPEEVVEILNYYFQKLADTVAANHGDIDKYVGDQIMANFHGANMAHDSVACSLAIHDVMTQLAEEHPEWHLDIGIGVDMGEVVVGAMGSKERMDYTVLGDHVNLSARLCSHAGPRETIVSENVAKEVANSPEFRLEALEPIHVKGKTGDLKVFSVHHAGKVEAPAIVAPQAVTAVMASPAEVAKAV